MAGGVCRHLYGAIDFRGSLLEQQPSRPLPDDPQWHATGTVGEAQGSKFTTPRAPFPSAASEGLIWPTRPDPAGFDQFVSLFS